jgi:hypothetical protein
MLNFLSLKQSNELGRCFVLDYFTNLDESVLDELVRSKQPNWSAGWTLRPSKHYLNMQIRKNGRIM